MVVSEFDGRITEVPMLVLSSASWLGDQGISFLGASVCIMPSFDAQQIHTLQVKEGSIDVDQSALTGESLPVTLRGGDAAQMGATVVRGETHGVGTPPEHPSPALEISKLEFKRLCDRSSYPALLAKYETAKLPAFAALEVCYAE